MYGNNPYAQAGWANPHNPFSIPPSPWLPNSATQGPTFGALPLSSSHTSWYTFDFTPAQPNILNCTVIGPGHDVYYQIVTTHEGITTIFSKKNRLVARIEWAMETMVEIHGVVARQKASHWLQLSPDQTYRAMSTSQKTFIWAPRGSSIYLYGADSNPPVEYGHITRGQLSVALKLTGDAFSVGVLDAAIVATLLLQSGRNL